jgi:hypothetical protein
MKKYEKKWNFRTPWKRLDNPSANSQKKNNHNSTSGYVISHMTQTSYSWDSMTDSAVKYARTNIYGLKCQWSGMNSG